MSHSSIGIWKKLRKNLLPLRSLINGRFVNKEEEEDGGCHNNNNNNNNVNESSSYYDYKLYDAATGKERGTVMSLSSSSSSSSFHYLLEEAVEGTREAQKQWIDNYTIQDRCEILRRASDILLECQEEVAIMESEDTGRPIHETQSYDSLMGPQLLHYYASLISSNTSSSNHQQQQQVVDSNTAWAYTRREPLGVTAAIGTWNYPLINAIRTSAPALAFGNGMIFKPSELTPTGALILGRIYQEAGIVDGLYNVVLGHQDVGDFLVKHPTISKISFVGSTHVGRIIYQNAAAASASASSFKRVSLEMGGKSPLIVCNDCILEDAVHGAMMANWNSNGQVCSNGTRVYVHSSIYKPFLEMLLEKTSQLTIGHPLHPQTHIGPMISKSHMQRVLHYIHTIGVQQDQAKLIYGGQPMLLPPSNNNNNNTDEEGGYYVSPAIFVDCHDDMTIVQDEIFGMVMTILTFEEEEDVIRRANQSKYGLAAGVFTTNLTKAHRMVQQLQAGVTWINHYNIAPSQLPWNGWKQSGLSTDDTSIESWTKPKSVYVEMGHLPHPYQY